MPKKSKGGKEAKSGILNADLSTIIQQFKNRNKNTAEEATVGSFDLKRPEINILPRYVRDKYYINGLQRNFLVVIVGLIVVIGAAFLGQKYFLNVDQQNSAVIDSSTSQTSTQIAKLTPYLNFQTNVDNKRQALATSMASNINYGLITEAVANAANASGSSVEALTIKLTTDQKATSCVNPDPFNETPESGCVTFTINGGSPAAFAEALKNSPGLIKVNVPAGGSDSVDGSVAFDGSFVNTRFNDFANLPATAPVSSAVDSAAGASAASGSGANAK